MIEAASEADGGGRFVVRRVDQLPADRPDKGKIVVVFDRDRPDKSFGPHMNAPCRVVLMSWVASDPATPEGAAELDAREKNFTAWLDRVLPEWRQSEAYWGDRSLDVHAGLLNLRNQQAPMRPEGATGADYLVPETVAPINRLAAQGEE